MDELATITSPSHSAKSADGMGVEPRLSTTTREGSSTSASCTVLYPPDVARRTGRTFFWRKWKTKFGLFFLSSVLIVIATLAVWSAWVGRDWFTDALGMLLVMNLVTQRTSLSRALARMASDPTRSTAAIETTDEGVKIPVAGSVGFLPWTKISFIWVYDDFLLSVRIARAGQSRGTE
jgi:hypothetical protein